MPDVILHELKIHAKLMQMSNRKVHIHIHVILHDDTWRILEYTFYSDESFLSDIQNLVKELNGKIKEVDKIMLYGHARLVKAINIEKPEVKNVILRQSGLRADAKMRQVSKQEMTRLMISMKQASAVVQYNHPKYEFQLDSNLHYLEIEPRGMCNNYKAMFEDLKFYDALNELDQNSELWIMVQINMPKQGDDEECDVKHVVFVDTSDNIPKAVGRSLDLLCENNIYNIDKVEIFPYSVL